MDNRVWRKDDFFAPLNHRPVQMDPAVVKLPEDSVPILWDFDTKKVLGTADNFRLVDDEILCDYTLMENEQEIQERRSELRLAGWYKEVVYESEAEDEVESCTLASISVVLLVTMPGYKEGLTDD